MKVLLTGVGTPIPSAQCAGPGTCVFSELANVVLQFDVGRATVMRLHAAGVCPSEITAVFLTHPHHDHVSGLADLALTRWSVNYRKQFTPLQVYAPRGLCSLFASTVLMPYVGDIVARLHHGSVPQTHQILQVHTFDPTNEPQIVYSERGVRVYSVLVEHDPVENAVGYSVDDNGEGHVVISGDTRECYAIERLIRPGKSTVVHEAMLISSERNGIADYHTDVTALARQMSRLHVPRLILTHLIPEASCDEHYEIWEEAVRNGGYENELFIGRNGLIVTTTE